MLKIDITLPIKYSSSDILDAICSKLPVDSSQIQDFRILKLGLNTADKKNIHYKASIGIEFDAELEAKLLLRKKVALPVENLDFEYENYNVDKISPVVIGAGPCGLFAALSLAEVGACPVILERGLPVEERKRSVNSFISTRLLDEECNVQFGEGGAGTYSDGKLKVGALNKYKYKILNEFISAGATPDIAYSQTAHLGTDKLSDIVKNIRQKIISNGGRFIYGAKFTEFIRRDGELVGVKYIKDNEIFTLPCTDAILAIGHSAIDTISALYQSGFQMQAKGFGVGARIEHPREYINDLVYGKGHDSSLETASYHLVTHLKNGRSVYSFCMCPGGTVVPAASEKNGIVTNGMSVFDRNADNSNAAFLVSVTPEDFSEFSEHGALAGLYYQRKIEKTAFLLSGADYSAPAIKMSDFAENNSPSADFGTVLPSYPLGTTPHSPREYLPDYICDSLHESISDFDDWMAGFYFGDAVITGPETRSTSPVRILRDEQSRQALFNRGVYPAGEGAGYAGGIISSALDGFYCSLSLLEKYKK